MSPRLPEVTEAVSGCGFWQQSGWFKVQRLPNVEALQGEHSGAYLSLLHEAASAARILLISWDNVYGFKFVYINLAKMFAIDRSTLLNRSK